jgi:3-dehydroquinate synthase
MSSLAAQTLDHQTRQHVAVALGERSYGIDIGEALLERVELAPMMAGRDVLIISNLTPAKYYLQTVLDNLARAGDSKFRIKTLVLPDGEQHKSFVSCERAFEMLAQMQASRDVTLIALGGGVVGDLTGFVAALWMRGVRFVQLPTTLLAMVDSSVGGKTAVNLPAGKNLVGAFWQPSAVIADVHSLKTLPAREVAAGMAEVIKYGALGDARFFDWLEANVSLLRSRELGALTHAIAHSCQMKADIVARDERETGDRMLLNLGHTFGHAIEAGMNYQGLLHGEAVAIGMVRAARLSALLQLAPMAHADRLQKLLQALDLPTELPASLTPEAMLERMRLDKKALSGQIRLILWRGIGQAFVGAASDEAILQAWKA